MKKGIGLKIFKAISIHTFLIIIAITCLFPTLWMLSSSLKTQKTVFSNKSLIPSTWEFSNYKKAWKKGLKGITVYRDKSRIGTIVAVDKNVVPLPHSSESAVSKPADDVAGKV